MEPDDMTGMNLLEYLKYKAKEESTQANGGTFLSKEDLDNIYKGYENSLRVLQHNTQILSEKLFSMEQRLTWLEKKLDIDVYNTRPTPMKFPSNPGRSYRYGNTTSIKDLLSDYASS